MATINRGPWNALVDDDGSNLVGSIWNKAAIQTVLLDPIDSALYVLTPTHGTFTPGDASGAGLVFQAGTKGLFTRFDRLVFVWVQVVYPATSNGFNALISHSPFPVRTPVGVSQGYGALRGWWMPEGENTLRPHDPTTFATLSNAQLSGANLIVSATYLTD